MNVCHASSVAIQPEGHNSTHFYSCQDVYDGAGVQEPYMVPFQFAIQILRSISRGSKATVLWSIATRLSCWADGCMQVNLIGQIWALIRTLTHTREHVHVFTVASLDDCFFFFELITNLQCSAGTERSNPRWNFPPFPYARFQVSPEEEFKWGDGKKIDFWKGLQCRNSESEEMGKSAKQLTAETLGSVPSRADCEPLKNIKPLFPESYDWARLQWPWKEMLQCNAALNEKLKKESLGRRLWSTTLRPAAVMLILHFKQSCTAERKYF